MANVVQKHSISYELAQEMVNAAVAKARELGVSENCAFRRWRPPGSGAWRPSIPG
jgi:hypothetical protein